MRMLRLLALTSASLALLACETPTAPASQRLGLSSDGAALTLTNPNSWPVFYLTMDPNILAGVDGIITDYALCTDPPTCARVAAKSTVRVPYTHIDGYHAGQVAVHLTQWRIRRRSSGEYEATDIQSFDATLQE